MKKAIAICAGLFALGITSPAYGQATRTWVSGVGDDVNPCSRTAPCKTFAGAISKTANGGEINCLDPGGFGAVTITKSIVINCVYTEGGALAGGNGVVVNATATDVVVLRGLDIFGVNPPTNGVRFIAGGTLQIEDSTIRRFNAANSFGVSFQPSGSSRLVILRTTISQNGSGGSGGGILIQPTGAAGNARVELRDVVLSDNANDALRVNTTGNTSVAGIAVEVHDTTIFGSSTGINIIQAAATNSATLNLNDSTVFNNGGPALQVSGTGALIRASNNTLTGNSAAVSITGGGAIQSYGDNRTVGNQNLSTFSPPTLTRD